MRDTNFFGEPGEPVPQVDPADIKRAWQQSEEERKAREAAGITGLGAVAGGVRSLSQSEIESRRAVGYRTTIFLALIENHEASWIENGELNEVLIRIMAKIPMTWIKPGESHPAFDEEELVRRLNDPHQ